jgi:hypothetical protein
MEHLDLYISIAANILIILGFVSGFFRRMWNWIQSLIRGTQNGHQVPRKTLRIVPKVGPNSPRWHISQQDDEYGMQLSGEFLVTNISAVHVLVPLAKFRKPRALGYVAVLASESNKYGQNPIPPGASTDLRISFWITPLWEGEGETFRAEMALVDNFGNEHWLKGVEFDYS